MAHYYWPTTVTIDPLKARAQVMIKKKNQAGIYVKVQFFFSKYCNVIRFVFLDFERSEDRADMLLQLTRVCSLFPARKYSFVKNVSDSIFISGPIARWSVTNRACI